MLDYPPTSPGILALVQAILAALGHPAAGAVPPPVVGGRLPAENQIGPNAKLGWQPSLAGHPHAAFAALFGPSFGGLDQSGPAAPEQRAVPRQYY